MLSLCSSVFLTYIHPLCVKTCENLCLQKKNKYLNSLFLTLTKSSPITAVCRLMARVFKLSNLTHTVAPVLPFMCSMNISTPDWSTHFNDENGVTSKWNGDAHLSPGKFTAHLAILMSSFSLLTSDNSQHRSIPLQHEQRSLIARMSTNKSGDGWGSLNLLKQFYYKVILCYH